MKVSGGCYCGELRYEAEGDPMLMLECHCRECQYYASGGPSHNLVMPLDGFRYTTGSPATFTRSDLEYPITREFCPTCHTFIASLSPKLATATILKVGTLDDPAQYDPGMLIYTGEMQPFHQLPETAMSFEGAPG